jgi:hypothetical protein
MLLALPLTAVESQETQMKGTIEMKADERRAILLPQTNWKAPTRVSHGNVKEDKLV